MAEPALELIGLSKSFGALKVTDGVSLAIAPGELLALLGPNGAGKTSLIHQICGTLAPDTGIVRLDGADITRLAPHARARSGLARTFQITSIVPGLSALDKVALSVQARAPRPLHAFRRAAGDESLDAPARAALERVGLARRAQALAGLLAHGEKRALEIAMALALEPSVILFDEPMAGAGKEESARLVDLLRGLKGGPAMLLVEHDMAAVFALADRLSVLVQGRIVATGAPEAVRQDAGVRAAYLGEGR